MDDNEGVADAWGAEPTPGAAPSSQAAKPTTHYDDGGEPDFEGWLNAQAAAKQKNNKALPKGLTKKTPAAKPAASKPPVSTKVASTGVETNKAAVVKKTETVKKQQQEEAEEDDDWGDAWG